MLETGTTDTVTAHVAVTPLPSVAEQVMVAVPAATAVIKPEEDTVATLGSLLLHVTYVFVALEGRMVTVS